MNTKPRLAVLSYSDKGLVLIVSLISISLCSLLCPLRTCVSSPFTNLKLRTTLLSHTRVSWTPIQYTEVSRLQGAGLGSLPRLLSQISVGAHVLTKLYMLMAAVWVLS